MRQLTAVASLALTLSGSVASGADFFLDSGEALPSINLSIFPMGAAGWQNEQYQYKYSAYTVAYSSTQAICWPDINVCSGNEEIFCDLTIHGIPETIDVRQVLVQKPNKIQQCMRREVLSGFENSMHDTVTYQRGIRP